MANFLFLFYFFYGSILIGMLSRICGAIDRSAVEFFENKLATGVEVDRAEYCDICTYICPRLFDIIQSKGLEVLYDNEDPEPRPIIEPYITPLVRNFFEFIY